MRITLDSALSSTAGSAAAHAMVQSPFPECAGGDVGVSGQCSALAVVCDAAAAGAAPMPSGISTSATKVSNLINIAIAAR